MAGDPVHTASTAYVLALDIGTSSVRAHVYDNKCIIQGTGSRKVRLLPIGYKQYVVSVTQLVIQCERALCMQLCTNNKARLPVNQHRPLTAL